jgi:hypothetical protein
MTIRRVFTANGWAQNAFAVTPGEMIPCGRVRAIMLDPQYARPGLRVAVVPAGGGTPQVLAPGDVAIFDHPSAGFNAWNARGWAASAYPFTDGPYSIGNYNARVGFLVTDSPGELLILQKNDRRPNGAVSGIGAWRGAQVQVGSPASGPLDTPVFFADGLDGMRVQAIPCQAVDRIQGTAPADFAATIRLWTAAAFYNPLGAGFDLVHENIATGDAPQIAHAHRAVRWTPNQDIDLTAGELQQSFDREVVAGAFAFAFTIVALAGTGTTHLALAVEGY